jgi:hypothetical protein
MSSCGRLRALLPLLLARLLPPLLVAPLPLEAILNVDNRKLGDVRAITPHNVVEAFNAVLIMQQLRLNTEDEADAVLRKR